MHEMFRCLVTTTLVALLVVVPVMAQQSETVTVSTPAGSAIHATARFSLVQDQSLHKHLEGEVTTDAGEIIRVSGTNKRVTFGDGYGLASEIIADTEAETVVRLTVTSATGRSASSVVTYNEISQTVAPSPNAAAARELLNESHDFKVLAETLPALASALQHAAAEKITAAGTKTQVSSDRHFSIKAMEDSGIDPSIFGCIGAVLVMIGAALLMVAACVIPEPLEPILCIGSVLTYVGSVMLALDACF